MLQVPVSDQERARAFWTETMGFRLVSDQEMGSERWIKVTPPDHKVVLVLGGPAPLLADCLRNLPAQLPHSPVFLTCDDIQKTHEELTARGRAVRAAPGPDVLRLVG